MRDPFHGSVAPAPFGYPVDAMYDEPDETESEPARDPAARAKEKADELRMHAELAAVFEGCRKFDAELRPGLDAEVARDVQRTIGRLEKAKQPDGPILPAASAPDAARLLDLHSAADLSTNDYHIHPTPRADRPGPGMVLQALLPPRHEGRPGADVLLHLPPEVGGVGVVIGLRKNATASASVRLHFTPEADGVVTRASLSYNPHP